MREETTVRKIYTFDELSEPAQRKGLETISQALGQDWDPEAVYEDTGRIAEILGIQFKEKEPGKPAIWFTGFWSQGDGASFEGTYAYAKGSAKAIRAYAPTDKKLHEIADGLAAIQKRFGYALTAVIEQSGNYSHSGTMSVELDHPNPDIALPEGYVTRFMRAFADWIYKSLEEEYEYQISDESVKEMIEGNGWEFLEDGTPVY